MGRIPHFSASFLKVRTHSAEELQQVTKAELNQLVNHLEESRKYEDGYYNHRRRCLDFLPSGKVDLLHLGPDLLEEVLRAIWPCLQPITETLFIGYQSSLGPSNFGTTHMEPASCKPAARRSGILADCLQNLAGAEGFEPPSPVLETGSLTVELTPLKIALGFQLSAFG